MPEPPITSGSVGELLPGLTGDFRRHPVAIERRLADLAGEGLTLVTGDVYALHLSKGSLEGGALGGVLEGGLLALGEPVTSVT